MSEEKKEPEQKIDWGKLLTAVLTAAIMALAAYLGLNPPQ